MAVQTTHPRPAGQKRSDSASYALRLRTTRWAMGLAWGLSVLIGHMILSWRIGVHWTVLAGWVLAVAILLGFLVLFLFLGLRHGFRSEPPRLFTSAWGRLRGVRPWFQLGTACVKLIGVLWLPVLVAKVWIWNILDVAVILTIFDYERRA